MSIGRFFAMIGALVRDSNSGKYLVLRRSDEKDVAAGEWECVTGRVDQGEGFPEAFQREVMEEIGVRLQPDFILRPSHFYRGDPMPENEMVGVMYGCSLDNPDAVQLSWEHSESRWVTPDDAAELFPEGHWLLDLIQRSEMMRSMISDELMEYFHSVKI